MLSCFKHSVADKLKQRHFNEMYTDYYMAIFISNPILAQGRCISAREPSGLRANIQRPRANIGCDINASDV